MVAAVCKLMRNQDLIQVARKCRVVTRFRNTIGAALFALAVYAAFLLYFGLYSRHHLVAAAPEEEFAAVRAAEAELTGEDPDRWPEGRDGDHERRTGTTRPGVQLGAAGGR